MPDNNIIQEKKYSLSRTLSLSLLIFIAFSIFQIFILFVILFLSDFDLNNIGSDPNIIENESYNHISAISSISGLFGILLTIYLCKYIVTPSVKSIKYDEILPLKKPDFKEVFSWLFILISFSLFSSIIYKWLGNTNDIEFTNQVLENSNNLILLFYGIGIAQPIFEEFLFRGILFKGLLNKLGGLKTVLITSFLFVLPHIQYDTSILIFVLLPNALILGFSRLKSKSLTIPIILHCANNILTLVVGILN